MNVADTIDIRRARIADRARGHARHCRRVANVGKDIAVGDLIGNACPAMRHRVRAREYSRGNVRHAATRVFADVGGELRAIRAFDQLWDTRFRIRVTISPKFTIGHTAGFTELGNRRRRVTLARATGV